MSNFNTSFDPLEGVDLNVQKKYFYDLIVNTCVSIQGPPPSGGSKLVHSPAEKENNHATVHSQWSPIKRNRGGLTADEECIRCTKHTAKYF